MNHHATKQWAEGLAADVYSLVFQALEDEFDLTGKDAGMLADAAARSVEDGLDRLFLRDYMEGFAP